MTQKLSTYFRRSKHKIAETNLVKLTKLYEFINEYKQLVEKFVNLLWNNEIIWKSKKRISILNIKENKLNCPNFLTKIHIDKITTNLVNAYDIKACAAIQALNLIKGAVNKRSKQLYKLKQLQKENKNTEFLQRKIDTQPLKIPNCKNINVELDRRFVDFQENNNHFDCFIQLKSIGLGKKIKLRIPIHYNNVSNKWLKLGKRKKSIIIQNNYIMLFYEIPKKIKTQGKKLGCDQGQLTCVTLSDGQTTQKCIHGHDFNSICEDLCRKRKGSKGFKRKQEHRKNYINWSINQLNFEDVNLIGLELIYKLRYKSRTNRKLSHWTYTLIKKKLVMLGEDKGFVIKEQDNKFRSQRCSKCGWTHKLNRKGKTFECRKCNFITDSDLNAASNHEVELIELPDTVWQLHLNRNLRFYWVEVGQECIVPDVNKF